MGKSKKILRIIVLLLVLSIVPSVLGVSIGVSPGKIDFRNMMRDGYAEQYVTISTSVPDDVTAHYEIKGEIAEWIHFEPESDTFKMNRDAPFILKIIATPPIDATTRTYTGEITFITDALASASGGMGSAIRAAVISKMGIEVTDQQIVACRAGGFHLADVEEGQPLEFFGSVNNDGNVRLRPIISIEIWDQYQDNILLSTELRGDEVLPTTQGDLYFMIDNELEIGQYWANVYLRSEDENEEDCRVSDLITFNVVEKGAIIDKGILEKVSGKVWAVVGEIIPITATFKNNGARSVDAKFKGKVVLEDEIIELLESDELRVEPGERVELTTYIQPSVAGRYLITGRVLYNNKLTFEKGTIVNVNYGESTEGIKFLPIILYLFILIVIIYLIYKIRKEKRKMTHGRGRRKN